VFDTGSPSNTALEQYYSFMRNVKDTCCREVVIIGGNHDSISTLNAPKSLLKYFNVHIIGGVPDNFTDQIIPITDKTGEIQLVICAVPFLRDKDVRLSVPGETAEEREQRIKQGIYDHYHNLVPHLSPFIEKDIPLIATGHLFVAGSSTSDSEKDIHMGDLGKVAGDRFPEVFDYIALGHIHRPQVINGMQHIRYSGSPVPLSFSESDNQKQVLLLSFDKGKLQEVKQETVPATRQLLRVKGDLAAVKSRLLQLTDPQLKYPAWVEVQVQTESFIPNLEDQLQEIKAQQAFIERFFLRQLKIRTTSTLEQQTTAAFELADLTPKEVFLKRCQAEFENEADYAGLVTLYDTVIEQLTQKENG
jgi:exonuclease SbcD